MPGLLRSLDREEGSVPGDDRAAELVVEADPGGLNGDAVVVEIGHGKGRLQARVSGDPAEIRIEVLALDRPVRGERVLNATTHRLTGPGRRDIRDLRHACGIVGGIERLHFADRQTAGDVEEGSVCGKAEATAEGGQPIKSNSLGQVVAIARGAEQGSQRRLEEGCAATGPVPVTLNADHKLIDLPVVTGLDASRTAGCTECISRERLTGGDGGGHVSLVVRIDPPTVPRTGFFPTAVHTNVETVQENTASATGGGALV
jgi:hypothetical protein